MPGQKVKIIKRAELKKKKAGKEKTDIDISPAEKQQGNAKAIQQEEEPEPENTQENPIIKDAKEPGVQKAEGKESKKADKNITVSSLYSRLFEIEKERRNLNLRLEEKTQGLEDKLLSLINKHEQLDA